jgi:hypothetical protein
LSFDSSWLGWVGAGSAADVAGGTSSSSAARWRERQDRPRGFRDGLRTSGLAGPWLLLAISGSKDLIGIRDRGARVVCEDSFSKRVQRTYNGQSFEESSRPGRTPAHRGETAIHGAQPWVYECGPWDQWVGHLPYLRCNSQSVRCKVYMSIRPRDFSARICFSGWIVPIMRMHAKLPANGGASFAVNCRIFA